MTSATTPAADESLGQAAGDYGRPAHRGRRRLLAGLVAVALVAGGVAVTVTRPFTHTHSSPVPQTGSVLPTSLASVISGRLSSQTQVNATLVFAGSYSVINHATGTFTSLPTAGQVIRQGEVLYRVDGNPVIVLYGRTPAYRNLAEGDSGPDVRQLNAALVALGYAASSQLDPRPDSFTAETAYALGKLQAHLGVTQTGTLALGAAVFLPGPARITSINGALGASAPPGQVVLQASSTTLAVTVPLNADLQTDVKTGDKVTITLPDGNTTPGVVSSVGTVATVNSSGTATINVQVALTDPAAAGGLDQAPVQVSITTASVPDALAVPVDALLALAGGGYAVEVAGTGGSRHLVRVSLGLFDDAAGLVQVNGTGLSAGQHVVVPAP